MYHMLYHMYHMPDEGHVSHVALRNRVIFTKFEVGQSISRSWLNKVLLLIRYVTLWPWPLILWPWTFVVYRLLCDQTLYQIWAKWNTPRRSYCDLSICNLGAIRYLRFDRNCIFTIRLPYCTSLPNFNKIGQGIAELLAIQDIFRPIFGSEIVTHIFSEMGN